MSRLLQSSERRSCPRLGGAAVVTLDYLDRVDEVAPCSVWPTLSVSLHLQRQAVREENMSTVMQIPREFRGNHTLCHEPARVSVH
jgi:hypothetical protein